MKIWFMAVTMGAVALTEGCPTEPTPTPTPEPTPTIVQPTPGPGGAGNYGCQPGYLGQGELPTSSNFSDNPACHISSDELRSDYNVIANDGNDDTEGLQAAIRALRGCATGYDDLSLVELPSGQLLISKEVSVDTSFMVIRGQGSDPEDPTSTRILFTPDEITRYIPPSNYTEGEFEVADMEDPDGDGSGGWIWPGRGAFRIQSTDVSERYAEDYDNAEPAYEDFYEGSVNFHWTSGEEVVGDWLTGSRTIEIEDASAFSVGTMAWVAAANSNNFYAMMGVDSSDRIRGHMRQQIFRIIEVDQDANTLTLDKPLEFDLYEDSTADGSSELSGSGSSNQSKVVPLTVVEGVGLEDLYLEQSAPAGMSAEDVINRYHNFDELGAMHGIVIKWSANIFVNNVHIANAGSHPIVTEMARYVQLSGNTLKGSWNKGKYGNGYLRLSKLWDSKISNNLSRSLRHLTLQWSASGNLVEYNNLDSDINFHGGWERYNIVENNTVAVPFEHRECNPDCSGSSGTWYPIWWAAGEHAGGWSGASGPQNILWNNSLSKQLSENGPYTDYSPYHGQSDTLYMLAWDRNSPSGSEWEHLALDGDEIETWTHAEEQSFHQSPNSGVNAQCSYSGDSLLSAETLSCLGEAAQAPTYWCR